MRESRKQEDRLEAGSEGRQMCLVLGRIGDEERGDRERGGRYKGGREGWKKGYGKNGWKRV